jgi:hypothetical protein
VVVAAVAVSRAIVVAKLFGAEFAFEADVA